MKQPALLAVRFTRDRIQTNKPAAGHSQQNWENTFDLSLNPSTFSSADRSECVHVIICKFKMALLQMALQIGEYAVLKAVLHTFRLVIA